jgi:hypothetical protein
VEESRRARVPDELTEGLSPRLLGEYPHAIAIHCDGLCLCFIGIPYEAIVLVAFPRMPFFPFHFLCFISNSHVGKLLSLQKKELSNAVLKNPNTPLVVINTHETTEPNRTDAVVSLVNVLGLFSVTFGMASTRVFAHSPYY